MTACLLTRRAVMFSNGTIDTSSAFPAAGAAVADKLHAAVPAVRTEIRYIEFFRWNRIAPGVRQFELDGVSLKAQAGTGRLLASKPAALDVPGFSVFHEAAAKCAEDKGDIEFPTLVMQGLDPFIMTGACSASVLAVT